ncbi:MAG: DUF882 domain-containing protein [Shimia sp.]|nr:DUF882 domain-containing protein [Shimia sp.]
MAISPEAQAAYDALSAAYGQPLDVISGYRSPEYNRQVGGASNSQHTHGNAFDINVRGMPIDDRLALASQARDAGFRGFGFYDNTLHFDVGPSRYWGPSHRSTSTPDWARAWAQENIGGAAPQGVPSMTPDPQPQGFMSNLFGGFSDAPDTSPTDPYANLSRQQRMMLGFAALRDAGASFAGRDTDFFAETLGGYESARERERLRTQGQAQSLMNLQQALLFAEATGDTETANLYRSLISQTRAAMGGGVTPSPAPEAAAAAGVTPPPAAATADADAVIPTEPAAATPAEQISALDQQIAEANQSLDELTKTAITGGITGLDYGPMIEQAQRRVDRLREEREALAASQTAAKEEATEIERAAEKAEQLTLPLIDESLDFLIEGFDPATGEEVINPMLTTRMGRAFETFVQSPEYQRFLGAIETLKTGTLLEALGEVTVGALSDSERKALSAMRGNLDPDDPIGSITTLREMRRIGQSAIDRQRASSGQAPSTPNVTWDN